VKRSTHTLLLQSTTEVPWSSEERQATWPFAKGFAVWGRDRSLCQRLSRRNWRALFCLGVPRPGQGGRVLYWRIYLMGGILRDGAQAVGQAVTRPHPADVRLRFTNIIEPPVRSSLQIRSRSGRMGRVFMERYPLEATPPGQWRLTSIIPSFFASEIVLGSAGLGRLSSKRDSVALFNEDDDRHPLTRAFSWTSPPRL
jgi:hypothetical protein